MSGRDVLPFTPEQIALFDAYHRLKRNAPTHFRTLRVSKGEEVYKMELRPREELMSIQRWYGLHLRKMHQERERWGFASMYIAMQEECEDRGWTNSLTVLPFTADGERYRAVIWRAATETGVRFVGLGSSAAVACIYALQRALDDVDGQE